MKKRTIALGFCAAGAAALIACEMKRREEKIPEEKRKSVLITGGSSGIGLEMAKIYAQNGCQVILAARNPKKLEQAANEIAEKTGQAVLTIAADLSTQEGNVELYRKVSEELGIEIDELVNSAGAGKTGRLIDTDLDTLHDLVGLNVSSMTVLNRLFGADMAERGQGLIMNVGSLSSFLPDPYLNVYGATKAYDLFLTEAMMGELQDTGVKVCCLCPGPVKTNWSANAGRKDSILSISPQQAAREGYDGMHSGKWLIIPGMQYKVFKHVMDLIPVPLKVKGLSLFQKSLKKYD